STPGSQSAHCCRVPLQVQHQRLDTSSHPPPLPSGHKDYVTARQLTAAIRDINRLVRLLHYRKPVSTSRNSGERFPASTKQQTPPASTVQNAWSLRHIQQRIAA